MCIIIYKPKDVKIPYDRLSTCFENNSDGAGFMYADGRYVRVDKGHMTMTVLTTALKLLETHIDTTATPMVIHFRTATHGDKTAGNTHPFILSKQIDHLLNVDACGDTGVAHNGMIHGLPTDKHLSDTMLFIKSIMADFSFKRLKQPAIKALIELSTNSKWAIMHKSGEVLLYGGQWVKDDGCFYSNTGYLETVTYFTYADYDHAKYKRAGDLDMNLAGTCSDDDGFPMEQFDMKVCHM